MALTFLGGIDFYEYRSTAKVPFSDGPSAGTLRYAVIEGFVPAVAVGDRVCINTPLMYDDDGFAVYSTVSGVVSDIADGSIAVENDQNDDRLSLFDPINKNADELDHDEFIALIKKCGIVGAYSGEPLYKKLSRSYEKVNRLILSCVESDPCSGHVRSFCASHTEEIVLGAKLLMVALGIKKTIIAFGEKDARLATLFDKVPFRNDLIVSAFVKNKYPQGNDRLLVTSIYNVEIPFSLTPDACGYLVLSAETVYNVYNCIKNATAVINKAMTVTGDAVKKPANIMARIGTPADDVAAILEPEQNAQLVVGGVLNGVAAKDGEAVGPSTNMLIATCGIENPHYDCIRCGRCAQCCPMHLLPYMFSDNYAEGKRDDSINNGLFNCIECGCCTYSCPSGIDLLSIIRRHKQGDDDYIEPIDELDTLVDGEEYTDADDDTQNDDAASEPSEPSFDADTDALIIDDTPVQAEQDEASTDVIDTANTDESTSEPQPDTVTAVPDFDFVSVRKRKKKSSRSDKFSDFIIPESSPQPQNDGDEQTNGGDDRNDG